MTGTTIDRDSDVRIEHFGTFYGRGAWRVLELTSDCHRAYVVPVDRLERADWSRFVVLVDLEDCTPV